MKKNLLCIFGHKFGRWEYVADNSCEQVRICKRDGYEERRKAHQFSKWKYITDDSCDQVRVCKIDGYEERRKGVHQFGGWMHTDGSFCKKERVCKRCGKKDVKSYGSHDFYLTDDRTEIVREDRYSYEEIRVGIMTCRNCGYSEEVTGRI